MQKIKKYLSIILLISLIISSYSYPAIANAKNSKEISNTGKELQKISDELPEDYDQSKIDEINNNRNLNINDILNEEISTLNIEEKSSVMAASLEDEYTDFLMDAVNNNYKEYQNDNESVSLATGALNYEKTLFSLPGRNGLDLDIGIRYNSSSAIISGNKYAKVNPNASYDEINFYDFAVGWSFDFPTIIKTKDAYGNYSDRYFTFSDGNSYKIKNDYDFSTTDLTLELQGYLLNDITLIRKADTKEYILTYSDGIKEYFDGTNCMILKREDRFGNTITFEYEEIEYFRGSFLDYLNNPSVSYVKLHTLSKITDSTGRVVNIKYNIVNSISGKRISDIKIIYNNKTYSTIYLDRQKCHNGDVDVISKIEDAENFYTKFEYKEFIKYSHNPNASSGYQYPFGGSIFALTNLKLSTGGNICYEYSKERKCGTYSTAYWAETYKVTKRTAGNGDVTKYSYVADSSGYPYSYSDSSTGYIVDSNMTYHTIVTYNDHSTIYTFDNKHNLISEKVLNYDNYIKSRGTSDWSVLVNGKIYSIDIKEKIMFAYLSSYDTEPIFLSSTYIGQNITISNVKTVGDDIYVFYKTENTSAKLYQFHVRIYNVTEDSWRSDESYTLPQNYYTFQASITLKNMGYYNGTFYASNIRNNSSPFVFHHLTYNPDNPAGSKWNLYDYSLYAALYGVSYLFTHNDYIYYLGSYTILYKYNIADNLLQSIHIDDQGQYYSGGFALNNSLFLYSKTALNEYDITTGQFIKTHTHPFSNITNYKVTKGYDDSIYFFETDDKNSDGLNQIYKFNPLNEEAWSVIGYKQFNSSNNGIIMGYNTAYVPVNKKYLDSNDNTGYECIKLNNTDADLKTQISNYKYNSYNQRIETSKCYMEGANVKELGSETYEYVNGKSAIVSSSDVLNNKTVYEYTNSPYYIPTKITNYADTDNELITLNTLSSDGKNIISSSTEYNSKTLTTTYTYSTQYPGNVITEKTEEIINGTSTILSEKEFVYDENNYVHEQEIIKNVSTNGSNFEKLPLYNISVYFTYDNLGNLISETNANGGTTSYQYNDNGWLTKTTYPDNSYIEKEYLPNSIKTTYNSQYYTVDEYDLYGNLSSQKESDEDSNEITLNTFNYYANKLESVYSHNGNEIQCSFDYLDRLNNYTLYVNDMPEAEFEKIITYDDYNLMVKEEYRDKASYKYYDIAGRIIKEGKKVTVERTIPQVALTSYEYDYMNNISKATDESGEITEYSYNDLKQLVSVTNPLGEITSYEYDKWGNIYKISVNNAVIQINEYDNLGRLQKTTDALGNSEYYAYDNLGNLISYKNKKGQIISYVYDSMNRLVSKQCGNIIINYTYDINGNLISMVDETGTTVYTYTYKNQFESVTTPDNKTISYTYDIDGNVTSVDDYLNNEYSYTYNGLNDIEEIDKDNTQIASYNYNETAYISNIIYPDGEKYFYYNTDGNLDYETIGLYEYDECVRSIEISYGYNIKGDITERYAEFENYSFGNVSNSTFEYNQDYTYDSLNRLSNYTNEFLEYNINNNTDYTYDGKNNIATKTYNSETASYTYNALNQLISSTEMLSDNSSKTCQYTYDLNGNLTKKETTVGGITEMVEYVYNPFNQLIQFKDKNGNITNYVYDGNGRRVQKSDSDTVIKYYWSGDYVINETISSLSNPDDIKNVSNYIDNNGIFGREVGEDYYQYLKDTHGDVVETRKNATSYTVYYYDAFGYIEDSDFTNENPIGYVGEYIDPESGFIYLRNRYYDPSIGRFISEDPINDGLNWYVYCDNNPIKYVDPTGCILQEEIDLYNKGQLSQDVYDILVDLGNRWENAKTDAARVEIHNLAEQFRNNNYKYQDLSKEANAQLWENGYKMYLMRNMGFSISTNVIALATTGLKWYSLVDNNKEWDYKKSPASWMPKGEKYFMMGGNLISFADFGNINYGYTGTALGLSPKTLYKGAGYIQNGVINNNAVQYYGDSEVDFGNVKRGIEWANSSGYIGVIPLPLKLIFGVKEAFNP